MALSSKLWSALPLTCLPLAAMADITPAEVLAEWQAYDAAYETLEVSYDITANTPDLIRLENVRALAALDMGMMNVEYDYSMAWLELRANGDGTVSLTMASTQQLNSVTNMVMFDEEMVTESFGTLQFDGPPTVISGARGASVYTSSYETLNFNMVQTMGAENQLAGAVETSQHQYMTDITQIFMLTDGPTGRIEFSFTAGPGTASGSTGPAEGNGTGMMDMAIEMGAQTGEGYIEMAAFAAPEFDAGALDFQLSSAIESLVMTMGEGAPMSFSTRFGASTFDVALNARGFNLAFELGAMGYDYSMGGMSLSVDLDRLALAARGPLGPRMRMGTAALDLHIEGLRLDDALLAMMDPSAALGRGPINLSVSAEGQTSALYDLSNPVAMEDMEPPQLRTFRFDVEGDYTDFNFNASGSGQMQGDMPVGTGRLNVTNLQAMLDRLSQAGLISGSDQAMAGGMIGMMFTPGPAPNSLQTSVETRADGSVFVNGQQMQ